MEQRPGIDFIYRLSSVLYMQHMLPAVFATLITNCKNNAAYDFSYGQSAFFQCYSVVLYKRNQYLSL